MNKLSKFGSSFTWIACLAGFCIGWLLMCLFAAECQKSDRSPIPPGDHEVTEHYNGGSRWPSFYSQTIEHDGCEYVVFWNGNAISVIHKPDCKKCFLNEKQ